MCADPDQELVKQAQSGDYPAFDSLVRKYEGRVYRLARRIVHQRQDTEEVVQQTFLSVLQHLEGFRGESEFATWLLRIATNHALALLRRRASHPTVSLTEPSRDDEDGLPRPEYVVEWRRTPEQIATDREARQKLTDVLDELDPKYSIVFVLRDLEEFSIQETAEILQLTENNVKVRLSRARLMLRERLTRMFGEEPAPHEKRVRQDLHD
ncbi:MAG TPA: sigma-70 family RNA polymerase sigma factor [Thermoguttaceae bacterium]|nr:sigma-70 family RNA polymerase sigma factor [Thermoguttaceae bacterium]